MKTLIRLLAVPVLALLIIAASIIFISPPTQPVFAQAMSSPCDTTVAISIAASNTQTLSTAVEGQRTYVCGFVISADTVATTGTFNSGSTALTGAMRMCDECNISHGSGQTILFNTATNSALTISAVTGAITGFVRIGRY